MTQLRNLTTQESREFWLLRRYLRGNNIPTQLSLRIQRFCEVAYHRQNMTLREENVPVLKLLNENLRSQLRTEGVMPHLRTHVLFSYLAKILEHLQLDLKQVFLGPGD